MKRFTPVLTCLCLALMAGPASADGRIGLSRDGSTWSQTLPGSLFDPSIRWVPGDSRTASFFVRNQAESGASLRVDVRSGDRDQLLANDDIRLEARAHGSRWFPLQNNDISRTLTSRMLGVGESVKVDVRAVFDAASTNQSQRKSLALRSLVTLADATAGQGIGGVGPAAWM